LRYTHTINVTQILKDKIAYTWHLQYSPLKAAILKHEHTIKSSCNVQKMSW